MREDLTGALHDLTAAHTYIHVYTLAHSHPVLCTVYVTVILAVTHIRGKLLGYSVHIHVYVHVCTCMTRTHSLILSHPQG